MRPGFLMIRKMWTILLCSRYDVAFVALTERHSKCQEFYRMSGMFSDYFNNVAVSVRQWMMPFCLAKDHLCGSHMQISLLIFNELQLINTFMIDATTRTKQKREKGAKYGETKWKMMLFCPALANEFDASGFFLLGTCCVMLAKDVICK